MYGVYGLIRKKRLVLTLVVIIAVSALIIYYTQIHLPSTTISFGDVTVEEAKSLVESNVSLIIVDVRTREEYDSGHIEGAILIPVSELEGRINELSKEEEFLIYCRTGNRSSNSVNILKANGYTKIFHMNDGIIAWIKAGYPTVN
ncbi:rhodanese-like domain-containing protein [Candidatus Bathyarchaeota archaeon]|nr:MAG: rhodanese-like domain-containing protein [Candidatus Bathyarchaeota archaeon]